MNSEDKKSVAPERAVKLELYSSSELKVSIKYNGKFFILLESDHIAELSLDSIKLLVKHEWEAHFAEPKPTPKEEKEENKQLSPAGPIACEEEKQTKLANTLNIDGLKIESDLSLTSKEPKPTQKEEKEENMQLSPARPIVCEEEKQKLANTLNMARLKIESNLSFTAGELENLYSKGCPVLVEGLGVLQAQPTLELFTKGVNSHLKKLFKVGKTWPEYLTRSKPKNDKYIIVKGKKYAKELLSTSKGKPDLFMPDREEILSQLLALCDENTWTALVKLSNCANHK
jgi:hypothetical protein